MGTEIERKWLLQQVPVLPTRPLYFEAAIEQGFLEGAVPPLRVRRSQGVNGGLRYYLTSKEGSGLARKEVECSIPGDMGMHLLEASAFRLVKSRYEIPLVGTSYIAEIDVFSGALAGLLMMEIEFPTEKAATSYKLPPDLREVVLYEVTGDPRYDNINLARTQKIPDATPE